MINSTHSQVESCRLIPFATVESMMRQESHILSELQSEMSPLSEYTMLLWLNDLELSDDKERLAKGEAERQTQQGWCELTVHACLHNSYSV